MGAEGSHRHGRRRRFRPRAANAVPINRGPGRERGQTSVSAPTGYGYDVGDAVEMFFFSSRRHRDHHAMGLMPGDAFCWRGAAEW
jgi:hypothetical protein